jgi:hypothetical protein
MKAQTIGYWTCTAIIAFSFLSGGIVYVMRVPDVVQGVAHLGFPLHFVTLLGVWKVLGAIALVLPGIPLVKEWAYAGIFFDLTAAAVAFASTGTAGWHVFAPLVMVAILVASWALRPDSRKLKGVMIPGAA